MTKLIKFILLFLVILTLVAAVLKSVRKASSFATPVPLANAPIAKTQVGHGEIAANGSSGRKLGGGPGTNAVVRGNSQRGKVDRDASNKRNLNFTPLSATTVQGIERFVLFMGYPRSGHSIIGSMMDAHPNMIIAHEYKLSTKWFDPRFSRRMLANNKSYLFNQLYENSYNNAFGKGGWRKERSEKGYNLRLGMWQGQFTVLRVIGDKAGGHVSRDYLEHPELTWRFFRELSDTVQIPLKILHVARNPYDMIATAVLYHFSHRGAAKLNASETNKYKNPDLLSLYVENIFQRAAAIKAMTEEWGLQTLELHYSDFIKNPKHTLQTICDVLDVACPEDYLQACYNKTFKTISKTRNYVEWTEDARRRVETEMKKYPFFVRYSFTSD